MESNYFFQLGLFFLILFFINKKHQLIMSKVDDVIKSITDLQASVDAKQAAIAVAIKDLEDQIAAGANPTQLQSIVDSLKAVQTDVESTPTA